MPKELTGLDALSKQLIQRAKAFQTVVRLGTYTAKVPTYSSLKACKGTMFFLPLPLKTTLDTLCQVNIANESSQSGSHDCELQLPNPELYIIVNGLPSKQKVLWQSIVNVSAVKAAIGKLRDTNWLYRDVNDTCIDDAAKQVIETVDSTSSTMLVKATKEDLASFQSYTIRKLNEKHSTGPILSNTRS